MKKGLIPVCCFAILLLFSTVGNACTNCQKEMFIELSGEGMMAGSWKVGGQVTADDYFEKASNPIDPIAIFEHISRIPRCSKHEEQISAWLVTWAEDRGWPVKTDEHLNVLISVPAADGFEDMPAVVLQAHMDMVCQKTGDSDHDFSRDPIRLMREGDWLHADGTTLGADNGIGIALALALAEDAALQRPALELLFTTDEEQDMSGAAGLAPDMLTGEHYINIDWETEGRSPSVPPPA